MREQSCPSPLPALARAAGPGPLLGGAFGLEAQWKAAATRPWLPAKSAGPRCGGLCCLRCLGAALTQLPAEGGEQMDTDPRQACRPNAGLHAPLLLQVTLVGAA